MLATAGIFEIGKGDYTLISFDETYDLESIPKGQTVHCRIP
jgi:hypothetical protein